VGRRLTTSDGERHVISVTPVARGVAGPIVVAVGAVVVVQLASHYLAVARAHHGLLALFLVGPCLVVVATRVWRWRSHKVHVTSAHVIVEGGVVHHSSVVYDLRDVVATRAEQHVLERLTRRGSVVLELASGSVYVGRVRHPKALCRVIDHERATFHHGSYPLDTVFDVGVTPPTPYWVDPNE
jgi:membrane protein YdbS with pleckstrin-like domain